MDLIFRMSGYMISLIFILTAFLSYKLNGFNEKQIKRFTISECAKNKKVIPIIILGCSSISFLNIYFFIWLKENLNINDNGITIKIGLITSVLLFLTGVTVPKYNSKGHIFLMRAFSISFLFYQILLGAHFLEVNSLLGTICLIITLMNIFISTILLKKDRKKNKMGLIELVFLSLGILWVFLISTFVSL